MTLGVRGAIERADGSIMLVRHVYTQGWFLPGGGVEKGEPALVALKRELQEEGGVALTHPPELVGIYSNHRVFPNDHVILYRVRSDHWQACESDHAGEIAEIGWFNPAALPEQATPGTKRRVAHLYLGAEDSDYW